MFGYVPEFSSLFVHLRFCANSHAFSVLLFLFNGLKKRSTCFRNFSCPLVTLLWCQRIVILSKFSLFRASRRDRKNWKGSAEMRCTESGEKGGGSGKEVAEEIRSCFRASSLTRLFLLSRSLQHKGRQDFNLNF